MATNLLTLSIVPNKAVSRQPYKIPYHNPSFPIVRYNKIICEYFFWKQVQSAEEVAKMQGLILVPSACLTWKRKKLFSLKMVPIGGKTFYLMKQAEMTIGEIQKFLGHVEELELAA